MGVDNLMSFVKNATTQTQISDTGLPKSTAAVDISHWIYKASYACPEAIYHRKNVNQIYQTIINYIDNYVRLLKNHGVKLTFVFDGMKLPAKEVILYCKRENIDYVVAPYEADAQLAYLNNENHCEFVITEDTDLILYGCNKIIYKLDTAGACILYEKSRLGKCLHTREDLDFEKFRRICILSGCDYLKNIPNVGLMTAKKFFLMTKQSNIRLALPKLAVHLNNPRLKGKVTEEYINGFENAESTFKHHIVYDIVNNKLRPLEPYPRGKSSSDFPMAGKRFHSTQAKEMVKGNIDLDSLNPQTDLDSASDASDIDGEDDGGDC